MFLTYLQTKNCNLAKSNDKIKTLGNKSEHFYNYKLIKKQNIHKKFCTINNQEIRKYDLKILICKI